MPNRRLNINESMRRVVGRDRGHRRDGGHPQNRADQETSFRRCHWWISRSRSTTETSVEMQHSETSLAHKWGPLVVLGTRIIFRSGRAAIFNNISLEYALGHCRVNKNTRTAIWELISTILPYVGRMVSTKSSSIREGSARNRLVEFLRALLVPEYLVGARAVAW